MDFASAIGQGKLAPSTPSGKKRSPTAPLRPLAPYEDMFNALLDAGSQLSQPFEAGPRMYIGGSNIGHECDNMLALSLRGFPSDPLTPRQIRTFRDGHRIELQVLADMKAAGVQLMPPPIDGIGQHSAVAFGGFARVHMDGLIMSTFDYKVGEKVGVLEIKSMAASFWMAVRRHGVKAKYPGYYDQMQWCMGLWLLADKRREELFSRHGLFVAANKNTGEYLTEVVPYDAKRFTSLTRRFKRIAVPARGKKVREDPEYFVCKMCLKSNACRNPQKTAPVPACNLCVHACPVIGLPAKQPPRGAPLGKDRIWFCNKHDSVAHGPCDHFEHYEAERGKQPPPHWTR